jgi:twitching motility protein PilT
MGVSIHQLLKYIVDNAGSDLHITVNSPPQVRIHGKLSPIPGTESLSAAETKQICYSILTDQQKHKFEETLELDLSFGIKGLSRFRGNVFSQRGAVAGAFRTIPYEIRGFKDLGLPAVVERMAEKPRGLILVTGPTGSGKSTTLAAMIDKINRERQDHIVTIEDPVEYLHPHKSCIVNQREIGADTFSFKNALKSILRQDPDVVLIGEMRDLETIEAALRIAETGHLTFATLHTNSAVETINRIIDVFPSHQQSQVRTQLSFVLQGILCQSLLVARGGKGRVICVEVMVPNAAIRNLIREDKIHQMYSVMQTGQGGSGMQTFNQSLADLYIHGKVDLETAMARSSMPEELQELINRNVTLGGRQMNAPSSGMPGSPPRGPVAARKP